jgi:hypothetical protein
MDKRRSKRIDYSIRSVVTAGRRCYSGFIENLSAEGFFIITSHTKPVKAFFPGTTIDVKFRSPDGQKMDQKCEVKWLHIDREPVIGLIYSMGMEIQSPSSEYRDFYFTLKYTQYSP